jgi:hypothetical protein
VSRASRIRAAADLCMAGDPSLRRMIRRLPTPTSAP